MMKLPNAPLSCSSALMDLFIFYKFTSRYQIPQHSNLLRRINFQNVRQDTISKCTTLACNACIMHLDLE